jgi:hypothetical protein
VRALLEAEHPETFLAQHSSRTYRPGRVKAVGRNDLGVFAKIDS